MKIEIELHVNWTQFSECRNKFQELSETWNQSGKADVFRIVVDGFE